MATALTQMVKPRIILGLLACALASQAQVHIRSTNVLPRGHVVHFLPGYEPSGNGIYAVRPAKLVGVPYRPLGSAPKPSAVGYVAQASDFRIVDGQLYNVMLSTNWLELGQWTGAPGGQFRVSAKGYDIDIGNWILVDVYKADLPSGSYNLLKKAIIRNPTQPEQIAIGESLRSESRVMRVGTATIGDRSESLEVYDLGLPNTPENRKTPNPPATSTNSVPQR